MALIDLDHSKRINDRFGHAAGDQVLRRFADLARDALRGLDRIRQRLRATPMHEVEPGLVVSFSAGVALCHGENDLEETIERADAAMYLARQSGGDRALAAV